MLVRGRLIELDGLRGIAALWVVVYHFTSGVETWIGERGPGALAYTPSVINLEGVMAVHLFFLISGFVISLTITRCATVADFAAGRLARLFPAYWFAVALATALGVFNPIPNHPVTLVQGLVNMTMLQEYLSVGDINPSFWSLAIELGFYVVIAGLIFVRQVRWIEQIGLVWVLSSFAYAAMVRAGTPLPWRLSAFLGLPSAPMFYAGILFYKIWAERTTALRVAGILACLTSMMPRLGGLGSSESLIEIGNFLVLAASVSGRAALLRHPVLQFFGRISYSLYVIHAVLGIHLQIMLKTAGISPWSNLALTLAVVTAVATAVNATVERPGGRLLHATYQQWQEARFSRQANATMQPSAGGSPRLVTRNDER